MSLHRVAHRLRKMLDEHNRGATDGWAPVAEAHRVLGELVAEDLASVEAALDVVEAARRCRADAPPALDGPAEDTLDAAVRKLDEVTRG